MDMNLSKLWEIVKDREAVQSMESQGVEHDYPLNNNNNSFYTFSFLSIKS